jgi:acetate kinase
MRILSLCARETAISATVFDMQKEEVLFHSEFTQLYSAQAMHTYTIYFQQRSLDFCEKHTRTDHEKALAELLDCLVEYDLHSVDCVAHHVLHGGKYVQPVVFSEDVMHHLHEVSALACENPPSLLCALSLQKLLANATHICVFDTAFHQTIQSQLYALPKEFGEQKKVGFYGISHYYVSKVLRRLLKQKDERYETSQRIIHVHLNGSVSVCAIKDGKSVDTTMGATSISGPLMPTKSGDIDPGLLCHLMKKYQKSPDAMLSILHKKSGLLALTDSSDVYQIYKRSIEGNIDCEKALSQFITDVASHICRFLPVLGGIDALAFSGSTAMQCPWILDQICQKLAVIGVDVNEVALGEIALEETVDLTAAASKINVYYVKSHEALEIARQAKTLVTKVQHLVH